MNEQVILGMISGLRGQVDTLRAELANATMDRPAQQAPFEDTFGMALPRWFPGDRSKIPTDLWIILDGRTINETDNPILFSIYGATLPDTQGRYAGGYSPSDGDFQPVGAKAWGKQHEHDPHPADEDDHDHTIDHSHPIVYYADYGTEFPVPSEYFAGNSGPAQNGADKTHSSEYHLPPTYIGTWCVRNI